MTQHLMEQPLNPALPGKVRGLFLPRKRVDPEQPDSVSVGDARSGDMYGVMWSQQYGAQCPRCGTFRKTAYRHMPWQDGRKTRYHRCGCGYRFKSIAEDAARPDCPPDPATLAFLRKYGK